MRRERKHLQDVLDQAIVKVREENQMRPADLALPLPSRRLVKRLVEEIPAFDRHAASYGHDTALRSFRSVEGHRVSYEPLERAEIDHTNLDLFAIDDETLLPLGRPWFSACEDDYTRCILGMFVGFIPPNGCANPKESCGPLGQTRGIKNPKQTFSLFSHAGRTVSREVVTRKLIDLSDASNAAGS